jgi:hypothetical protein
MFSTRLPTDGHPERFSGFQVYAGSKVDNTTG